jgi:hypothetical protein
MLRYLDLGDDDDGCPLSVAELGELSWGPASHGSLFQSRGELCEAWDLGRDYLMKYWGDRARRPAAFYEFEWKGEPPDYDRERSTLWRANMLAPAEKAAVEGEWYQQFQWAYSHGLDAARRRQHYKWADIPSELTRRWARQHRHHGEGTKQPAGEASESALPAAPALPPT